jgi:4-hydroxyacetophenone monooxygenase
MSRSALESDGSAQRVVDRAQIEEAVADAHLPSLLMTLVHLTGDLGVLTEARRPRYKDFTSVDTGVSAEEQSTIRRMVSDALEAYLGGRKPLPPSPSDTDLRTMMNFIAGTGIPDAYVPFLREELGIGLDDPRRPDWHVGSMANGFHVVVIGAGMSGLLMALRLKQAGIRFTVIEKNSDVGGTWFENTYPGCRVDLNNQIYSYSFAPRPGWPHRFSEQPALLEYFRDVAEQEELRRHILFQTTVARAEFDPAICRWKVSLRDARGNTSEIMANALVSAVGQLNTPRIPNIRGLSGFKGVAFHSAQWRHDASLEGKRVAVIGTGASALQFVPQIATSAREVILFQRTPPWLLPTPDYHHEVPEPEKWLLEHAPFYANWYRFWLFWLFVDGLHVYVKRDPQWPGSDMGAVSDLNRQLGDGLLEYIRNQLKDRPDLLPHLLPKYPFGAKRPLRDNGIWLSALKRDNVRLIVDPIDHVSERGIVTANGSEHTVDAIIFGTGFHASKFLWPMTIIGRHGKTLEEAWAGDARAYLGITVPEFPNLYCIYGPNTNLVVNGSITFFSECAVGYIMEMLRVAVQRPDTAVQVKQDVFDRYNAGVDAANRGMAWGLPEVSNWYKNESGRVTQNWPYPTVDYWRMTKTPNPDDYEWTVTEIPKN